MRFAFERLAARISLVSIVHLLSMLGVIFLVSWATFEPSVESGIVRHAELCVTNMVTALSDPKVLKEEAESLAAMGVTFAVYSWEGELVAANASPPIAPLKREELGWLSVKSRIVRHDATPIFARSMRLAGNQKGQVLFSPPAFGPPIQPLLPGLLLALVASATGAVLLARSFARPLTQLSSVARRLGSGDLTARADLQRHDEFGQLSDAFDDMAEQLGRLVRAQQELLANVSHELRTPLARIHAALDFASEADPEMARAALCDINEDLAELERLVADVLQTARLDLAAGRVGPHVPVVRLERLDLHGLVGKSMFRFTAKHSGRRLSVRLADDLPELTGDPVLVRRVLDNLLDNAQKYSDADTPIAVTVQTVGSEIAISVVDRGIGIAQEDLPRVTQPFFRTDRSRARKTGGLGLGLSLARRITEAHGGTLSIESQVGVGTTVHILLPSGAHDDSHALRTAIEPQPENDLERERPKRAAS
jgi:signal transduction histidine kinase